MLVYEEENPMKKIEENPDNFTTLTAFFELNKVDDFARSLLSIDIPKFHVFKG